VLDYGALFAGGSPVWWRHSIFASAGCLTAPVALSGTQQAVWPLIGDASGMIWQYHTGQIEHDTGATLSLEQRVNSAELVDNEDGTWTLTCEGINWPDVAGQVVVVRDGQGLMYTGLVTASTEETLTVRAWAEGRVPADGTVEIWLGGIDARLDTLWLPGADPMRMKVLTGAAVVRGEPPRPFDLELRATDTPDDLTVGTRDRWRRRVKRVQPGRSPVMEFPCSLRGRLLGLRVGNCEPGADWTIRELRLRLEATEGVD